MEFCYSHGTAETYPRDSGSVTCIKLDSWLWKKAEQIPGVPQSPCSGDLALPDCCARFIPTLWTTGNKCTATVMKSQSATYWTCTKPCSPAMGHRRTFLKKRLFLQDSSFANLLLPTFINIPVQRADALYLVHLDAQPVLTLLGPIRNAQKQPRKKKKRERE